MILLDKLIIVNRSALILQQSLADLNGRGIKYIEIVLSKTLLSNIAMDVSCIKLYKHLIDMLWS